MSQIVIGISDELLKRVDAVTAAKGGTRESIALRALEAELARFEGGKADNQKKAPKGAKEA